MKQKDIVWVRLPFSDLERQKARPALVVSNDAYNRAQEDVIVCALTSNLQTEPYKVAVREKDLESGKLPLSSMVRADKILQVEKVLIDRALGRLTDAAYDQVSERIQELVSRRARAGR
ncbi:MAG TPA: type II toxin-antitoxin system PemK/MazF family toxin [Candidatus Thermoplasmatota archaeon]|nr:type II toxin-antitoxin system PemK/MazF family toxin [Candidatus Thermoplasmatota archaeon]